MEENIFGMDIIWLNVGGKVVCSSLNTIKIQPKSRLAHSLTLWLSINSNNREHPFFIDADYRYFRPLNFIDGFNILNFLRLEEMDFMGAEEHMVRKLADSLKITLPSKSIFSIPFWGFSSSSNESTSNNTNNNFYANNYNTNKNSSSNSNTNTNNNNHSNSYSNSNNNNSNMYATQKTSSNYNNSIVASSTPIRSSTLYISPDKNPKRELLQSRIMTNLHNITLVESSNSANVSLHVITPNTFRAEDPSVIHEIEKIITSTSHPGAVFAIIILLSPSISLPHTTSVSVRGKTVYILYFKSDFEGEGLLALTNAINTLCTK